MLDQAYMLRGRVRRQPRLPVTYGISTEDSFGEEEMIRTKVIAVTSGKGGVGKTNIVVNLAAALVLRNKKVLILDADFGLANVDVLLGLAPKFHLGHFLWGEKCLKDLVVTGPKGIAVIPAAPGIQVLTPLKGTKTRKLIQELKEIIKEYDFLLIDTATGISDNVTRFLVASQKIVVVCTPDPTAVVDAYAVIKIVLQMDSARRLELVVNGVTSSLEGEQVFQQIAKVTKRFLARELIYLGYISQDDLISRSVREQRIAVLEFPFSRASFCFRHLAKTMIFPEKTSQNSSMKISEIKG